MECMAHLILPFLFCFRKNNERCVCKCVCKCVCVRMCDNACADNIQGNLCKFNNFIQLKEIITLSKFLPSENQLFSIQ